MLEAERCFLEETRGAFVLLRLVLLTAVRDSRCAEETMASDVVAWTSYGGKAKDDGVDVGGYAPWES
jgi:hypothetical protein